MLLRSLVDFTFTHGSTARIYIKKLHKYTTIKKKVKTSIHW